MKQLLLALVACLSVNFGLAQYEFTCEGLGEFGRGELGERPQWAVPYCTSDAEDTETLMAANFDNIVFMQSYEALLDLYGGSTIADDIKSRMAKAGYRQVDSDSDDTQIITYFENASKGTRYMVLLREKDIDFYLLLAKSEY